MATSKGKGGAGRPRNAETTAALALAESVASAKVEPRESWKVRTVHVAKDGTVSLAKRKGSEPLTMETPTPETFAGVVVVAREGSTVDKTAASLRESVGRLLRSSANAGNVASLSEGFAFDDGTDGMVVLFHRAAPESKPTPKPVAPRKASPAKVTRKAK